MAQPGESVSRVVRRFLEGGGNSTGKVLGDFTIVAYAKAYGAAGFTTYAHGSTITELADGRYELVFTLPASAGFFRIDIDVASGTDLVSPGSYEGEVENFDWDGVANQVIRPVATLTQSIQLGDTIALQLVADRYRELVIPVQDANGDAIDLNDYNFDALTMGVSTEDQTTFREDYTDGVPAAFAIAIDASGNLTITIPEDLSLLGQLPAGEAQVNLFWEITGNQDSIAAQTIPIIRSSVLTVLRSEVGQ